MGKFDIATLDDCLKDYLFLNPQILNSRRHYVIIDILNFLCKELNLSSYCDILKTDVKSLLMALQKYVNLCIEKGQARKTIMYKLFLIRSFLSFYDIEVPSRKIKIPRNIGRSRIDRIPSLAELQKLISGSRSARMRLLLMTLALTGMRLGEALSLRREWIDFERNVITLPPEATKMGRGREIPIPTELKSEMKRYFEEHFQYQRGYIFSARGNPDKKLPKTRFYELYHHLLKRLGLNMKTPDGSAYQLHVHVFRKWYKTQLESAGVNKILIDLWMGHNSGIDKTYYLPTADIVKKEFEKADSILRIFGGHVQYPAELEQRIKALEDAIRVYETLLTKVAEKAPGLVRRIIE